MTELQELFFIVRIRLDVVASANRDSERRLTLHIRRTGPRAADAKDLEEIVRARIDANFQGYLVSELQVTQVTQSTYETAKLMQIASNTVELDQTKITSSDEPDYQIVPSALGGYFRVVSPNGDESALYSQSECEEIVRLAKEGALLGNFNSGADLT